MISIIINTWIQIGRSGYWKLMDKWWRQRRLFLLLHKSDRMLLVSADHYSLFRWKQTTNEMMKEDIALISTWLNQEREERRKKKEMCHLFCYTEWRKYRSNIKANIHHNYTYGTRIRKVVHDLYWHSSTSIEFHSMIYIHI